jgi:hypothetical protein
MGKLILGFILSFVLYEKTDYNSGLRVFKTEIISRYLSVLPKRFGASTVTTLLMQERNYAGGHVPIIVRERVGKSSVRQFRDGMNTICLALNIVLMFRPMQVFGLIGVLSILIGTIYGVILAITEGLGVPTLSVIAILIGIQLLVFGVISHQIAQIRCDQLERS